MPKSRTDFWNPKIARNRLRDIRVTRELRRSGWRVVRIWEHQLSDPEKVIGRLQDVLASRRRLD